MGYRVFFSHSVRDKEVASWAGSHANAVAVEVYLFEHDAQPGVPLASKIKQEIARCDALLLLLTPNSVASHYVQQEIGVAMGLRKLIIALAHSGVRTDDFGMLQGLEYIPLEPPDQAVMTLKSALSTLKAAKERDQAMLLVLGALVVVALGAEQ